MIANTIDSTLLHVTDENQIQLDQEVQMASHSNCLLHASCSHAYYHRARRFLLHPMDQLRVGDSASVLLQRGSDF